MPASQLFAASNPTMTLDVPGYGKLKVPTDFKGRFKIDKMPDGTLKIDLNIASNASDVVESEGERAKDFAPTREAEFAMRLEEKKIEHETLRAIVPEFVSFIRSLIPVKGDAPGDGPGPANPSD